MVLTTLHRLSEMDLFDRSGEKVGRIRDVLLDPESGRCDYLLMSTETGAFTFGGTGNLTPIPVSLLTMKENSAILDASKDIVQGAPSFSPREVGSFSGDYREKLNSFWGLGKAETTRHAAAEKAPAFARTEEEPLTTRRDVEPESSVYREERAAERDEESSKYHDDETERRRAI